MVRSLPGRVAPLPSSRGSPEVHVEGCGGGQLVSPQWAPRDRPGPQSCRSSGGLDKFTAHMAEAIGLTKRGRLVGLGGTLPTRILTGSFSFDEDDYEWELRRETQWCTVDGWQGMQVAVRATKGGGREALLQFPMSRKAAQRARGHRHRPQVHQAELEAAIRLARSSGWDPYIRGKPFHLVVS